MRIEIKEMSRASTGDIIEIEGKVFRLKAPSSNDFDGEIMWGQFVVVKDETGEQGCWLNLKNKGDKVAKGTVLKVKGKVGKEYEDSKGRTKRSLNGCAYELIRDKVETKAEAKEGVKQELDRDSYWAKKFEYEIKRDKRTQLVIARQCAIKAVTELAGTANIRHVEVKKWYFGFADEIVRYIYFGKEKPEPETKKETESKPEAKPEEEQRPATEAQKRVLFGYEGDDGIWKGIVESRFITKKEVESIGEKDKVSFDTASYWIGYWWGEESEIGERAKREMDAMPGEEEEPASMSGLVRDPLVKKNPDKKSSLKKDMLIDDINALRRENFLMDETKFQNEFDVNGRLESLSEKKLGEIKKKFKTYTPKDWDK